MLDRWQFLLNRIGEKLWVKPLLMAILSTAAVLAAGAADQLPDNTLPAVSFDSVETLLKIISSSMLVIATFAVGSMVSAYASASNTATPRAFALVVADDASQNSLSAFVGAFIFSIVALVALLNDFYGQGGRSALFGLTLLVFAIVILTFVRWVDRIARLGRLETTIRIIEQATREALLQYRRNPNLGGVAVSPGIVDALPVYGDSVGYVQRIEIEQLQSFAEKSGTRIEVAATPGSFIRPLRALAFVHIDQDQPVDLDLDQVAKAFLIGSERTFDEDPRFGLVALSEIASRALSSGVNDAGTAIQVIGSLVRILYTWEIDASERQKPDCDRVAVPGLDPADLYTDAFRAIGRDGAGIVEVVIQLQKGLGSLASSGDIEVRQAAIRLARDSLARAEQALALADELVIVRGLAQFAQTD